MAKSIAKGLKGKYAIQVCGRDYDKARLFCDELGGDTNKITPMPLNNLTLQLTQCDEILICIKPIGLHQLRFTGKAKCVYSILNGITTSSLKQCVESQHYIRAMPNICASVGRSITSLCGDEAYKQEAIDIFHSIGRTVWLEESDFPIATALGGCAPAFLALVAESLIDSGVMHGLSRDSATAIVRSLFDGFANLLEQQHPTILRENVTSPGGSTAQGVAALERCAIRNAFIEAISASKGFA